MHSQILIMWNNGGKLRIMRQTLEVMDNSEMMPIWLRWQYTNNIYLFLWSGKWIVLLKK